MVTQINKAFMVIKKNKNTLLFQLFPVITPYGINVFSGFGVGSLFDSLELKYF